MKTFLEHVAASLLQKYGSNLRNITVIFPGKRASLFLNQALAEASPTPVWAPRYQTISELFERVSPYALCDPIEAVCRLYRSYARFVPEPQSLDQFYSWGEILLTDFDDVDKQMVDAHQLFSNIKEIRELDDNAYITPEQEAALKTFFSNFSIEENTALKERFLRLWNHMGEIYDDFRQQLRQDGLLYEGALHRDVVEQMKEKSLFPENVTYVFVGFNVLTATEEALFDALQARHQALFYWDYDVFYTRNTGATSHEAGFFIRRNLQRYGNELPAECFDNLQQPKDITFITTSTENAQARYMPSWLAEHTTERENQTAVVLCNEQLLHAVLHSLPTGGTPRAVNVTMGFGLSETPVYSFICALVSLQTESYDASRQRFRPSQLSAVESHPFAAIVGKEQWFRYAGSGTDLLDYLIEIIHLLARHFAEDNSAIYHQLYTEALFQTFTALSRLRDLMTGEAPLLTVNDQTLRRVLRCVLTSQTIPFHGEPATGLQIMGVLETRVLDFQNLLMLSVGEGFLPKAVTDTSLIPYYLKEAFGLTTIRHKIAIYAYYFFRLIQRAEHVTLAYNESNSGIRQNEQSRFLRQLLAETDFPIRFLRLTAQSKSTPTEPPVFEKTPEIMQQLRALFDNTGLKRGNRHFLSPSAINQYTACPLRFYYRYIQGLRIEPNPSEGLDPILFGNIFHRSAEIVYKEFTSRGDIIHQADIEPFVEKGGMRLQPIIRQAFRECFFLDQPEDYSGILIVAERVLHTYLLQLLRHDLRHCPIRILGLEVKRTTTLYAAGMEIDTGGIIDRLDEVSDPAVPGGTAIRVLDYKTGGLPGSVSQMEQLFSNAHQKEEYYLQSILYATIVAQQEQKPVTPCLFFVHKSGAEDYSPKLRLERQPIHDVRNIQEAFLRRLTDLISDIFNPNIPFTPTTDLDSCSSCHYRTLCGR
ncbi:MAG: PD-(D/E)XK nuclease family protein [Bacteroidaceae bacterium]|nr:PD-(D/E)XK nuclease family protein [Bacteroidaceae bacterium]